MENEYLSYLREKFLGIKIVSKEDILLSVDKFSKQVDDAYIRKNKVFKVVNIVRNGNPFHLLGDDGVYEISMEEFNEYFDELYKIREDKLNILLNEH